VYGDRKIIRLQGYDYSSENLYYVTTVVHDRICWFGEIIETVGTGRDPSIPTIVNDSIGTGRDPSIPTIVNDSVGTGRDPSIPRMELNKYGEIAKMQWDWIADQYKYVVLHAFVVMPNHVHGIIEIDHSRIDSSNPVKIKPLTELMGAYKTTVSKRIHLAGCHEFKWQRSYYEHIIRDEYSYNNITKYIIENPIHWNDERTNYR
jgi:putative transposase